MPPPPASSPSDEPLPWHDPILRLPRRLPAAGWVVALGLFVLAYGLLFTVIHPLVDMRPCLFHLPDPVYRLVPNDPRWYWVSWRMFVVLTVVSALVLIVQAARGDHRPLLRYGTALGFQGLLRALTLWLVPLCREGVPIGTRVITGPGVIDLGLVEIPWRPYAVNDLVFSGHMGEVLLLFWATRHWPRPVRVLLVVFMLLLAFALVATRGHYTVDVVLAVPCAAFADLLAVEVLSRIGRTTRRPRT